MSSLRFMIGLMLVLANGSVALAALPSTGIGVETAWFELRFPRPVQIQREDRDGGWVLRFSQPLDTDLELSAKSLEAWVASMWGGFDSLLIKPQAQVDARFQIDKDRVRVEFRRSAQRQVATEPAVAPPSARQAMRLARLDAIWLVENGRIQEAVLALRGLVAEHPNEADLRIDLAGVESRLGHWSDALAHYDRALALLRNDPRSTTDDAELARARADLWRENAPYLRVETWRQRFGDSEVQRVVKTDLRVLLDDDSALEFEHRLVGLEESTAVRDINGVASTFDGTRQRLRGDLLYSDGDAGKGRIGFTFNGVEPGLRWRHQWFREGKQWGGTHWLSAVLHEAWDELPEALIGYGFRDGAALGASWANGDRINSEAELGVYRYGLDGFDDAVRSWNARYSVRYLVSGPNPSVDVGYGLDKVQSFGSVWRVAADGTDFKPLPLSSSEVHSVDVSAIEWFGDELKINGQLGYGYDRKNGKGVFANFGVVYAPWDDFEAGLSTSYSNTSGRAGDSVLTRYNLYLKWWF
ncbi:MAG: tetratricopeptide repeat protein [Gammaproteobacteria bacterium]|nr:tetratricopeptide repeat protein [Gammaproteobacteria bacterium]MCP5136851.1 tetratricopeptide repeat protein [Gammaproteobacteria bacterium]